MTDTIKSLWAGEVPLREAFWTYAVAYGLILNMSTSALFLVVAAMGANAWVLVPVFLLPVPYNFFMIVAVWRSAGRYQGSKDWADLARILTLLGMLLLSAI